MTIQAVQIYPVHGIPLVKPGDDIADLIVAACRTKGLRLKNRDIVVVTQKIVSKAEGRLVDIRRVKPTARARTLARRLSRDPRLVSSVLTDSSRVIKLLEKGLIVETKHGLVCLNAGLDKSNVKGNGVYCRLPEDSDDSARRIQRQIYNLTGVRIRVIVSDTYSRPLRAGQVQYAIGVAGLDPIVDYRGTRDLFGYRLKFKYVCLADEIAAAAELVIGQGKERVPAAIVRRVPRVRETNATRLGRTLNVRRKVDLFADAI